MDLKLSSTLGTCNFAMGAARSLNSVQAMKTETVQTRQLLWISECTHTHRTGYFIMKIVQQGFYIHSEIRKQREIRDFGLYNDFLGEANQPFGDPYKS